MKIYKPKALIDGSAIGQAPGTSWVAVPDKFARQQITVEYAGAKLLIKNWRKEAVMFRRFRDKFWTEYSKRPQYYTLGYFRFTAVSGPKAELAQVSAEPNRLFDVAPEKPWDPQRKP